MAAMDFGMAVTAGIIPASKEAQKDLINLAGGREVFKSEGWWNRQVNKQISSGYRTVSDQNKEFLMPSGEYKPGKKETYTTYGRNIMGQFVPLTVLQPLSYSPNIYGVNNAQSRTSVSYKPPEGAVFTIDPRTKKKEYTSRFYDVFGNREDYTAGELSDIEKGAKRGAERVKREAGEKKASKKRLVRGTGGLVGKARAPGDAPATGLPELGTTGLGMTAGLFGADIKL